MSQFGRRFLVILVISCISFVTLTSSKKVEGQKLTLLAEEKTWMDPLFRKIMLHYQGIYTLEGSKPMTMISLEPQENDHLMQNWENWEQTKSKFPFQRFALFKKADAVDPNLGAIYFADLTKVALVIQENYNLFKKETGFDFDALDESLKLEQGSEFWDKVFDQPALLGIVLGYGVKNSFCFQWKYCPNEAQEKISNALFFSFSDKLHTGKATVEKLSLPIFASFSNGVDEVVQKYRAEREEILALYNDKNFLTLTLQKLTQSDQF